MTTTKRKNIDNDKRGFKKTSFLAQKLNQNGSVLALIIFLDNWSGRGCVQIMEGE